MANNTQGLNCQKELAIATKAGEDNQSLALNKSHCHKMTRPNRMTVGPAMLRIHQGQPHQGQQGYP